MRRFTAIISLMAVAPAVPVAAQPADIAFFEARVRPLLAQHCYACHSAKARKLKAGLLLDSREGLARGGDSGPVLVPGQPAQSLLVHAVRYENQSLQMPPSGKLLARDIAILEEWVRRGAPFPAGAVAKAGKDGPAPAAGRNFWSFRPPRIAPLPAVKNAGWPLQRVDHFILAQLETKDLEPSPPASRQALIRRGTFDLIGLPPTPEQVNEFVKDDSAAAYSRLIDRLLASPRYGERWGRFWLDLARYCDIGEPWSENKGQPYLYRDWVVKAFNDDLPYDQFVVKQLAADLLPGAPPADRAALGFIGLSPSYWKELKLDPVVIETVVAEEWEERIHTLCSTFLGLTAACARCHDHKFDPITMKDYYALAGVFASTRLSDRPLLADDDARKVQEARARMDTLEKEIKKLQTQKPASAQTRQQIEKLQAAVAEIKRKVPTVDMPLAPGVAEASLLVLADGPHRTKLEYRPGQAQDVPMQIRGNPARRGPVVARRFLEVLSPQPPRPFTQGSGRLELARAIVTEGAPLAARVIVNRVWKHHFGKGLVETPSDFGSQGERPSHPELLDDLAARFIQHGWSIKWLHREIMLSATYRQASSILVNSRAQALDPDNRLLWRMQRRRLEVEAWRDAMLAGNGTLDPRQGGPAADLGVASNNRRTLYGTVKRRELSDLLRLHDFPDPTTHSPNRLPTTTPLQQLFVLNSPFMREQAAALARRVKAEAAGSTDAQVRRAYLLLFGRAPTPQQMRLATEFLGQAAPPDSLWEQYAQVLLASNEFLYVD